MAEHVFISYSRTDSVYVQQLVDYLRQDGLEVWIDEGVDYGDRWVKVIRQKIDSCAAFVIVMTPEVEESEWVEREIVRAEAAGRPILPLLLSGKPIFQLSNRQCANVVGQTMPDDIFVARLRGAVAAASRRRTARSALLIGCDGYDDRTFRRLRTPVSDIRAMATLLGDEQVGRFDTVDQIPDGGRPASHAHVRQSIEEFFLHRDPDDFLLLFIASQGIRAADGELFFAMKDSQYDQLPSTAISSSWLRDRSQQSRSDRILVLLDYYQDNDAAAAGGRGVAPWVGDRLGRVVVTASRAIDTVFEASTNGSKHPPLSPLVDALVTGIGTGAADRDDDGRIGADELFHYVREQLTAIPDVSEPTWQGQFGSAVDVAWRRPRVTSASQGPPRLRDRRVPRPRDAGDLVRVVPVFPIQMRHDAKPATVQRWLHQAGDRVEQGSLLLEVAMDGRLYEIDSPATGTLRGVTAVEGELVDSMTTVGVVVIGASGRVPPLRTVPRPHGTLLRTADIRLPSAGMTTEATVTIWWRQVGDRIESGQPLLQITNGSIEMDIIAMVTGTLRAIAVVEGEAVGVEEAVAIVALD